MMLTNQISVCRTSKYDLDAFEVSKINLDRVTLKISKVLEMTEKERCIMFEIFNKFKFVILECKPIENPQENLLALKKFFGSVKRHKRSNKNGITTIENLGNSPLANTYLATTNQTHLIHTDGPFEIVPPKVVAMQCEIPSENGGISQIVYAQSVYRYLMENHLSDLQNLFIHPISITRDDQTATRAIFVEKEGRMSMSFRSDTFISLDIPVQLQKVFKVINNYVNDPKNQFMFRLKAHQIIILENTSILHGRTAFPDDEVRKLNRLWFDGISEYSHYLKFGFLPHS